MSRELLDTGGVAFGVEEIKRDKKTREIKSEPFVRHNGDFIESYCPLVFNHSYTRIPNVDITVVGSIASSHASRKIADGKCASGDSVILVGFPNWHSQGDEPAQLDTKINQMKAASGGIYAAVNLTVLSGASGGSVLNSDGEVIGVIANSKDHNVMPNAFITIQSLDAARSAPVVAL